MLVSSVAVYSSRCRLEASVLACQLDRLPEEYKNKKGRKGYKGQTCKECNHFPSECFITIEPNDPVEPPLHPCGCMLFI